MTNEEMELARLRVENTKLKLTKAQKAYRRRKAFDQAMRDMGMRKVKGCVTGETYWE